MSTVIGSVTLERDMVFSDEFNYSLVNAEVTPTLGGGTNIQEFTKLEKGRPITLISAEGFGYQLKPIVTALQALAKVVGATYDLKITDENGTVFRKTVRFRNEIDGGAVQLSPVQAREAIPLDTMYYGGTISLMVVNEYPATTTTTSTTSTTSTTV